MSDDNNDFHVERALRDALAAVELVCEADVPPALVDEAEGLLRPMLAQLDYDDIAKRYPASLVAYFVLRGSQVYSREGIWEQLGVFDRSSAAGQAFLRSLAALGLPQFAEETDMANARRFVTPMLVHGAFPAGVASRLIECVESELRRGVIDGSEARVRLLRHSDIELTLRRPATRLLQWCPAYADRLLDTVIDHIENPSGNALDRLPRHLLTALQQDVASRRGLRRLRTPFVEFSFWTGIAPEVVGAEGTNWLVRIGSDAHRLPSDGRIELSPDAAASVAGAGRNLGIWPNADVWFFDWNGRLVPPEVPLPRGCIALVPQSWAVWDSTGERIAETEEGSALTGAWSGYRSFSLALAGISAVQAGPRDDPDARSAQRMVDGHSASGLVGQVCAEAVTSNGAPVYSLCPNLSLPSTGMARLRVRFTSDHAAANLGFATSIEGRDHEFSLTGVLPAGTCSGTLDVLGFTGRITPLRITVVPGLTVDMPPAVLGPDDEAVLTASADDGGLDPPREHLVPAHATQVGLRVRGLASNAVVVPIPRLRWALRSSHNARLEFADGPIHVDAADLIGESSWLLARSGVSSEIGLRLMIDGREAQFMGRRRTTPTGPAEHQRSFALDELRDTIRSHRESNIEIVLVVGGTTIPAIVCQGTEQRSWRPHGNPIAQSSPDNSLLSSVAWLQADTPLGQQLIVGANDRRLLRMLRQADAPDAVVAYLRALSVRHCAWKMSEFPKGLSADDWDSINQVANDLWRIDGVRLREFAGDWDGKTARWARTRREEFRRAPDDLRRRVQRWLLTSRPQRDRLTSWRQLDILSIVLPAKSDVTAEWMPGSVMFHVLAVLGGDDESGPVVAEAMAIAPSLVLETLACVMQYLRTGQKIAKPVLDPLPEPEHEPVLVEPENVVAEVPSLDNLIGAQVEIEGRTMIVIPPLLTQPPVIRVSRNGRPLAIISTTGVGHRFTTVLPSDVCGGVDLGIVDPRRVLTKPAADVTVSVETHTRPNSSFTARTTDLSELESARLDHLVDYIATRVESGAVPLDLGSELFDDARAGAAALTRAIRRGIAPVIIERAAIASLSAAFLFTDLHVDLTGVAETSPLLYAVLAPRRADAWRRIGWPNAGRFVANDTLPNDFLGFVRKVTAGCPPVMTSTFRYRSSASYPNSLLLARTFGRVFAADIDRGLADVMVATHRLLTLDEVAVEATRLLLDVHTANRGAGAAAIIAGIAATLATTAH